MENQLVKFEGMTPDKIELIKNTVAKGASNDELALFLTVAKRAGLDPFSKQIHFVKRKTRDGEVGTIQTGIDGYRSIAERTKTLAGIDDAVFDSESETYPKKASVTVYRKVEGERVPFTASARWSEYAPVYNGQVGTMWKKMPYLMLGKCAEALALRKAFPNDLSGLYTNEEMAQAENTSEKKTWTVVRKQESDEPFPSTPVPTVQMDADTAYEALDDQQIPTNEIEQKKIIMSFVKQLEPETDMRVSKEIAQVVANYTELALISKNFPEIIVALKGEIGRKAHE